MGILQRHSQYATKADFRVLSHEVKTHINHLEEKTDRLEKKTDRLEEATVRLDVRTGRLEMKTDRLEEKVDHLDQKVTQFEARMSSELADIKSTMNTNMDYCKTEFSKLRADVAVLTNSHKYVLWIWSVLATMCVGVFGLCISILFPLV